VYGFDMRVYKIYPRSKDYQKVARGVLADLGIDVYFGFSKFSQGKPWQINIW